MRRCRSVNEGIVLLQSNFGRRPSRQTVMAFHVRLVSRGVGGPSRVLRRCLGSGSVRKDASPMPVSSSAADDCLLPHENGMKISIKTAIPGTYLTPSAIIVPINCHQYLWTTDKLSSTGFSSFRSHHPTPQRGHKQDATNVQHCQCNFFSYRKHFLSNWLL